MEVFDYKSNSQLVTGAQDPKILRTLGKAACQTAQLRCTTWTSAKALVKYTHYLTTYQQNQNEL